MTMNDNINTREKVMIDFVPTRDLVVFPNMTVYFDVGRSFSVKSIKSAMENDTPVFLAAQKDVNVERPEKKDCFSIGTVVRVKQIVRTGSVYRVLVEGVNRAKLINLFEHKYGYEAESASALIEAANILIANPTQELEAELEQEKSDAEEMEKAAGGQFCWSDYDCFTILHHDSPNDFNHECFWTYACIMIHFGS